MICDAEACLLDQLLKFVHHRTCSGMPTRHLTHTTHQRRVRKTEMRNSTPQYESTQVVQGSCSPLKLGWNKTSKQLATFGNDSADVTVGKQARAQCRKSFSHPCSVRTDDVQTVGNKREDGFSIHQGGGENASVEPTALHKSQL